MVPTSSFQVDTSLSISPSSMRYSEDESLSSEDDSLSSEDDLLSSEDDSPADAAAVLPAAAAPVLVGIWLIVADRARRKSL